MRDLTTGSINKKILAFALPVFMGNLFNLFYNLADTRIIGYYLGEDALAAVGSVSTLSDLLISFIVGLANGFAVITARHFGAKEKDAVRRSFGASIFMGLIITTLFMIIALVFLQPIMGVLNVEDKALSAQYVRVIIGGLLFTCLYNVMASSLRSIGDAYTPLIFLIISACLNIGMDMLFVGAMNKGVAGAAIATVIAQVISVILCIAYTWIRFPQMRIGFRDLIPSKLMMRQMLPAGFSMGIMSSLVAFGTLALQGAINSLGKNTVVAHSATRKFTSMFMMPFSALGITMATFAGQNYGAGNLARVRKGLKNTLLMSYAWVLVVIVVTNTIYPYMIKAITATQVEEIINTAWMYQRVDTLFYMLVPTITILRNTLQGIGDHTTPIFSSFLELLGKLAIAIIFTPIFGYWAIIWSEPIVWTIMVIPLIISIVKKLKKI